MILTADFLIKKHFLKLNGHKVYVFKNKHPHQIGYYAVEKAEFDTLCENTESDLLPEMFITVFELDLIDDTFQVKPDANGNKVTLGKRKTGDLEMADIDQDFNVLL
jgi:hypothetical protein